MIIKLPVHIAYEYLDCTYPEYVEIEITDKEMVKLNFLSNEVKKLGVWQVRDFIGGVNQFVVVDDATGGIVEVEDFRWDTCVVGISNGYLRWDGYIKHMEEKWVTEEISIEELNKLELEQLNNV